MTKMLIRRFSLRFLPGCERSSSFKEKIHPKFRKNSSFALSAESNSTTNRTTPSSDRAMNLSAYYPAPAIGGLKFPAASSDAAKQEEGPLDMSIKKRSESPPPPPPYRYTPLRRSPPPAARNGDAPALIPHQPHLQAAAAPVFHPASLAAKPPPPPYQAPDTLKRKTPSPPAGNAFSGLPPPPSYETASAAKRACVKQEPVSFATVSSTTPTPPIPNKGVKSIAALIRPDPPREVERVREITIITSKFLNRNRDRERFPNLRFFFSR